MALQPGHLSNFNTLKRAFANGDVALMECTDANTGEVLAVLCMVNHRAQSDDFEMVPIAKFFNGNPYEELVPPTLDAQEPTTARAIE